MRKIFLFKYYSIHYSSIVSVYRLSQWFTCDLWRTTVNFPLQFRISSSIKLKLPNAKLIKSYSFHCNYQLINYFPLINSCLIFAIFHSSIKDRKICCFLSSGRKTKVYVHVHVFWLYVLLFCVYVYFFKPNVYMCKCFVYVMYWIFCYMCTCARVFCVLWISISVLYSESGKLRCMYMCMSFRHMCFFVHMYFCSAYSCIWF